jgi:hypothetical protein
MAELIDERVWARTDGNRLIVVDGREAVRRGVVSARCVNLRVLHAGS